MIWENVQKNFWSIYSGVVHILEIIAAEAQSITPRQELSS